MKLKKFIVLAGSILGSICLCPAYAATYSGNCGAEGDNVTYTLNTSTGVLTISGTGAMEDYSCFTSSLSPSPWDGYRSYIKSLVVNNGVTELGDFAFYNLYNLTSVSLPTSVTLIPFYGFAKCSSLSSITIPTSVTNIGNYAFRECTSLTSISIPSNAVNLGSYIFQDCSNLKNATFGTGITIIPVGCFVRCPMTDFTIPSHITRLNQEAFSGCAFTTMTIPNTVTSWGRMVFNNCANLTDLYVSWTTTIPKWDDYNTLVDGTTNAIIHVPCGTSEAYRAKGWSAQLIVAGDGEYSGTCGASGDNVKWILDCDGTLNIYGTGAMADWSNTSLYAPWGTISMSPLIQNVVVSEGVTTIGVRAFHKNTAITSVSLPSSITNIKESAFLECANLSSVIIPTSVSALGNSAFSNCSKIKKVTIPIGVTSIGGGAFANCSSLMHVYVSWNTSATIPTWPTSMTTKSPQSAITLHVPCGTKTLYQTANGWKNYSISEEMTGGCCGAEGNEENIIWTLSCDSVLTVSGTGAMTDKQAWSAVRGAIKTAIIGDGITTIGNSAFNQCSKLTSVTIGKNVTSIGTNAFYACRKMESVYISDLAAWCRIGYIDSNSCPFYRNGTTAYRGGGNIYLNGTLLTELSVPQEITEIKPYAFYGCTSIISISSFGGATSIGEYAFAYCENLSFVTIPEGITTTGNFSFGGCAALQLASIPASLTTIDARLFSLCNALTDVYVHWTENIPSQPNSFTTRSPQNSITLHVPCGAMELYQAADGWKNYNIYGGTFTLAVQTSDATKGLVQAGPETATDTLTIQVDCRTTLTLTAVPEEGYRFVSWSTGDDTPSITITVTDNITLSADFEIDIPSFLETMQQGQTHAIKIIQNNCFFILTPDGRLYNILGETVR